MSDDDERKDDDEGASGDEPKDEAAEGASAPPAEGDAEASADGDAEAPGEGDAEASAEGVAEASAEGDAEADAEGDAEASAEGDADGSEASDADAGESAKANGTGGHTENLPSHEDTPEESEPTDLAQTLLHSEIPTDDKPGRRWAYPVWAMLLVTCAIAWHGTILLVHNLPSKGLSKGLLTYFNKEYDMHNYMRTTGSTQSWAMFAPNPHRSNIFMKVLLVTEDEDGEEEVLDLKHDIWKKRTYPYLWYSRRGKINRRIVDQEGYRRHYAAWVCRDWERKTGTLPVEIRFIKMWTRIPTPEKLLKMTKGRPWLGYDPTRQHLNQREEETIRCKSTQQGQLPPHLRERYGMEPAPEGHYRPIKIRTWVDKREAERRKAERDKKRAEIEARRAP